MNKAFISYSRKDKTIAVKLHEDLEFRGLQTWLDLQDIPAGSQWSTEIEQAIVECPLFLLLLSPHAVVSEYVEKEYQFALEQQKTLLPILLQPCEIPAVINPIQYINLQNYGDGFKAAFECHPPSLF